MKPKCCSCVPGVVPGLLYAWRFAGWQHLSPVPVQLAGHVSLVLYHEAENDNNTSMACNSRQRSSLCSWERDHCRRSATFIFPTLIIGCGRVRCTNTNDTKQKHMFYDTKRPLRSTTNINISPPSTTTSSTDGSNTINRSNHDSSVEVIFVVHFHARKAKNTMEVNTERRTTWLAHFSGHFVLNTAGFVLLQLF